MLYKGHSDIQLYALPRFLVSKSAHRGSTQIPNIERLRFELRCRRAFQAPCGALLGVLEIRDPQNHRLRLQNGLILDDLGGYSYSRKPSIYLLVLKWVFDEFHIIPSDSSFGITSPLPWCGWFFNASFFPCVFFLNIFLFPTETLKHLETYGINMFAATWTFARSWCPAFLILIPHEDKVDVITPCNILVIGGGKFWSLMKIKLMLLLHATYWS